jgi:hypothetical protein
MLAKNQRMEDISALRKTLQKDLIQNYLAKMIIATID